MEERVGRLWKDKEEFAAHVFRSPTEQITDDLHANMHYASHHVSVEELTAFVSKYHLPPDVDAIARGYHEHASLPFPIVLMYMFQGKPGYRVMSGNTRLVAELHHISRQAIMVDATDNLRKIETLGQSYIIVCISSILPTHSLRPCRLIRMIRRRLSRSA